MLPDAAPEHKATITPRGRALGLTRQRPEPQRNPHDRTFLFNNLCTLLGGRIAEEIVFNEMTTGAGNDIERVSDIARRMVCEWGMSEAIGPMTFKVSDPLNGRPGQIMSEETARLIDGEVKKLIRQAYDHAKNILTENRGILDAMSQALLDKETISREDIAALVSKHQAKA
jgi:cell division protease FtsH